MGLLPHTRLPEQWVLSVQVSQVPSSTPLLGGIMWQAQEGHSAEHDVTVGHPAVAEQDRSSALFSLQKAMVLPVHAS